MNNMFIAGAFRYNDTNAQPTSLSSIVMSMMPGLSCRNKQYHCAEDSLVCFASNNEPQTNSDLILIYSGQFFNVEELKVGLSLSGDSSLEAVLKSAYKKWGHDFATHIAGEFTIALYDKINKKLFLSRDRVGLKPLYYFYDNNVFIFASDVKALLKAKNERHINFSAFHSGIVFGSVYSREHLIEGIYELRAGHNLIMDYQSIAPEVRKYWDRVFNITAQPFSVYKEKVEFLLNEAVKKRLPPTNEKAGVCFSGGIDSTLVLALVKKFHSGSVEAYTAIAAGDKLSEHKDARLVARKFNINHKEIFISALEAIQALPKIIWHLGEFSSHEWLSVALQTYFVGKLAKENGCGCVFTGNGVEHNFDGNGPQRNIYKYYRNSGKIPTFILKKLFTIAPSGLQDFLRRNCSYTLTREEMDNIAIAYVRFNSPPWWDNEERLKDSYSEEFFRSIGNYNASDIISDYLQDCTAKDYFNKLLYIDFKTWNSRRNLVTNERLFGAFGLQLQIPFLDVDLVEFSSSMPVSVKHNFKDAKFFIRKIYKNQGVFPEEVFKKGKFPSLLHFNFWGKDTLDVILYFVSRIKQRKIFKEGFIDGMILGSKKGNRINKHRHLILNLFQIELWFRIFIDNPGIQEKDLTLDYLGR
ncbi:MAG: asparagine synthase-related protein [Candidatus Omnitrophota bacterium]